MNYYLPDVCFIQTDYKYNNTSRRCCALIRITEFSVLSWWFSSCNLMMLFFAIANCNKKDDSNKLVCNTSISQMRLDLLKSNSTSSMSLELDVSKDSTRPCKP